MHIYFLCPITKRNLRGMRISGQDTLMIKENSFVVRSTNNITVHEGDTTDLNVALKNMKYLTRHVSEKMRNLKNSAVFHSVQSEVRVFKALIPPLFIDFISVSVGWN